MTDPCSLRTSLRLHVSRNPGHRQARVATSLMFLTDGMVFGTWATLIPSFKARFALNESGLSLVLFAMVIGALVAMPVSGRMVAALGSRRTLGILGPTFCGTLALLVLVPSFPLFVAAAAVFGAFKGGLEVSMNSQSIIVENAAKRPIIATFHALWSLGGLGAALIVSTALGQNVPPTAIALSVSALLCLLVLPGIRNFLPGDQSDHKGTARFQLPGGKLLGIGLLASLALFAEGAMMDWSVVYAQTVAGAAPWLAPLAYGVFSCTMACGRFAGDALIHRFGPSTVLRIGGASAATGIALIAAIHHWPFTFAGLALAGFGLSNLVPVLFGAAGREHPGGVGQGIATVSMMGYAGFLAGPPIIGSASHFIGLPSAFLFVVALTAVIALLGKPMLAKPSAVVVS